MAGEASRSGDSAGTLEHLRAAERIAPRDPRVLKELLNYFSNAKAPDQAEVYCAKLAALDADQAGGRLFRFQLALARNDLEAANSLSRELTAQYPELSKSWYAAGKIAQMQGAYGAARGAYEQALKKEPTHAGALRGMAECYIDSPYPAMALVAIKHAREMLPGDPSFFQMQLDYEAKFESAETALASRQEAARLDPDDRRNWLALCAAFIRAASYDSAPHSPNEKQALASSAQKSVNDMLAKWPNDPELRVAAASVLRVEGKPMEAVEQLRAAMRRAPDDIDVLNNLACMLLDDVSPPQPSEALGLSQRAFDLMALGHALSPAICDTRGWALIRNGRTDEGIKLLEQTAAKTPSAAIRYHLAEAYLQKSLPNEAQAQLAGAMELVEEARKQGRPADAEFISQVNSATTRAAVLARHSLPR
jgi:tetratricopeptide (TPR) repeat protein